MTASALFTRARLAGPPSGHTPRHSARRTFWLALVWLAVVGGGFLEARAVILMETGDPSRNTTEPGGALAGSGWQYQGLWGAFLGTPVSSNLFLTARHVRGQIGDSFSFGGRAYVTTANFVHSNTDLALWKVDGVFPTFAPLYSASRETGQPIVVFGRGAQRGEPMFTTNGTNAVLRGWLWGRADNVLRWGTNLVLGLADGGDSRGPLLVATFDQEAGGDEATLAGGDSGGGVFIHSRGAWRLAGINYAVSGPYNTGTNGSGFNAALFDARGLYVRNDSDWELIPDENTPAPGAAYAVPVSAHLDWIHQIIATESGPEPPPLLEAAASPAGPYLEDAAAVVNLETRTIARPLPAENQFFRLRHFRPSRISSCRVQAGELELGFEWWAAPEGALALPGALDAPP